jgi:hypothetical protein
MPSDDRIQEVLAALQAPLRGFHSTLVATADDVRSYLGTRRSSWEEDVARVRAELGPLAAGRIDASAFAAMFEERREVEPIALPSIEESLAALTELATRTDGLCLVDVPPGGSLYEAVSRALAEIGRAFAAARLVHAVRAGREKPGRETLDPFAFSRWSRAERRVAPPLVVRLQGRDLRAATLAEFLDGRLKIVLVLEGESAPAPLVRLVAPGTYVLQSLDASGLDRLVAWEGPGVAALVPESAARFRHDPGAGSTVGDRITIDFLPAEAPRRALGGISAAQQAEELELLRTLAARPAGRPESGVPAGATAARDGAAPDDPADRLAAWLLSQVDLSEPS